jgi:hypothetical protein
VQPALVRAIASRAEANQRQVAATNTLGFTFSQTSLSNSCRSKIIDSSNPVLQNPKLRESKSLSADAGSRDTTARIIQKSIRKSKSHKVGRWRRLRETTAEAGSSGGCAAALLKSLRGEQTLHFNCSGKDRKF